jgi:hypothetical protein
MEAYLQIRGMSEVQEFNGHSVRFTDGKEFHERKLKNEKTNRLHPLHHRDGGM